MTDSTSGAALSQPLYGASFGQAVSRFFKKYATFSGRASRSEYWWVVLAGFIANGIFAILYAVTGGATPVGDNGVVVLSGGAIVVLVIWSLFALGIIIPSIALTVRRLHDGNFSGWLYLLHLIPSIGSLIVLILTLLESKPEGARFDK